MAVNRTGYNMKNKGVIVFVFAVLSLYCSKVNSAEDPKGLSSKYKGYNVILIILDALRPDHLSCYGYAKKTSHNIDELAKEGVLFTNAFSQASYTLPSVISIFTSVYPYSHGTVHVLKDRFPDKLYSWAKVLNNYGYRTVWFGYLDDPQSGSAEGLLDGFNEKYHDDTKDNKMIFQWIRRNGREPFFITIHSYSVHEGKFPFMRFENKFSRFIPQDFLERFDEIERKRWDTLRSLVENNVNGINTVLGEDWVKKNRQYIMQPYSREVFQIICSASNLDQKRVLEQTSNELFYPFLRSFNKQELPYFLALLDSSIYGVDNNMIGGLVNTLKETNLYDKTIIIITADHGNEFMEHGDIGHSRWLYDEVMRVPLIIHLPEWQGNSVIKELVQSIDIFPTTLDLLGVSVPRQAQGISLVGLMGGNKNALRNEYVICQGVPVGSIAVRTKNWKLIRKLIKNRKDSERLTENDFKWQLFNLKKDPHELRDLIETKPDIADDLRKQLELWRDRLIMYKEKDEGFIQGLDQKTREKIRSTGYW